MKPCLAIPIYDHGSTIVEVVDSTAHLELPCIIVDDGSHEATQRELARLEERYDWDFCFRPLDEILEQLQPKT